MPRKQPPGAIAQMTEEFEALTIERHAMADKTYKAQDGKTKAEIDKIADVLRQQATGVVAYKGRELKVSDEVFGFSVFYLAVQLVADLYFAGVKVANFKWNLKTCASCGGAV